MIIQRLLCTFAAYLAIFLAQNETKQRGNSIKEKPTTSCRYLSKDSSQSQCLRPHKRLHFATQDHTKSDHFLAFRSSAKRKLTLFVM